MRAVGAVQSRPIVGSAEPAEGLINHLNHAMDLENCHPIPRVTEKQKRPTVHSEL